MKILAGVFQGDGKRIRLREIDLAEPGPGEVLVKIVACGVCHTDIWMMESGGDGDPIVLGHEASGIVEKIGSRVKRLRPGDHVVMSHRYCGRCVACRRKRTFECDHFSDYFYGLHLDGTSPLSIDGEPVAAFMQQGGFATHAVCHPNSLIPIDKDLDLRCFGPMGCGFQTGAGAVLNCLKPKAGHSLAVLGTGAVGLAAVMAAKIAECNPIIAVDRIPSRLRLARSMGATHTIHSEKTPDIAAAIQAATDGEGIEYAFDTSGDRDLLNALRHSFRPGAHACGVGIGGSLSLTAAERAAGITWEEPTAGWAYPQQFIPRLIAEYRARRFPFTPMLRFYPFKDINKAIRASRNATTVKPVLLMD